MQVFDTCAGEVLRDARGVRTCVSARLCARSGGARLSSGLAAGALRSALRAGADHTHTQRAAVGERNE